MGGAAIRFRSSTALIPKDGDPPKGLRPDLDQFELRSNLINVEFQKWFEETMRVKSFYVKERLLLSVQHSS
jgi:hypothetical protein